jgi:3-methyladenine DNA glycosylase AlkD
MSDRATQGAETIRAKLRKMADRNRAKILRRFFKTGPGEYGEGDVFLGIAVPELRKLAKSLGEVPPETSVELLRSEVHEDRSLALMHLVRAFERANRAGRRRIYRAYLDNVQCVNNWDLVDGSAEHIVGAYLADRDRAPLVKLAGSRNLWERRIAIVSTFHYIKRGEYDETLKIAAMLLDDDEDLIHKATGWMLREVGKRRRPAEEAFLLEHYRRMPRTMLRYAIERFPEPRRQAYLKGTA